MAQSQIGRPKCGVIREQLACLIDNDFTVGQVAQMLKVSKRTVERRMNDWNLNISQQYSDISDADLDETIRKMLQLNSSLGYKSLQSRLRISGHRLQRERIRDSLTRVRGAVASNVIRRRIYSVPGPLHLWHIDGNHKLVRWRFVIHGGIDGFSRLIVFMCASDNNRSSTVLSLFKNAVHEWGLPSRVRSDKGLENTEVARYMLEKRGLGRRSHITGKSVHNTRIERLWRDLFTQCTSVFYKIFWDLENASLLDPDAENDLFALHYVFSGLLSKEIHTFVESWNRHQLRTEGNRTPLQMYIAGTIERHLPNNCFPELHEDEYYGVENSEGSEEDSEDDEILNTVTVPAVQNPLNDVHHAYLLLTFPRCDITILQSKETYSAIRHFVNNV